MLLKNHPIILFIDRNGFTLFQDTMTTIPRFNFTPDLVANLDVISKTQFSSLIATFIQINKIVPSSLAVILSDNVIYVKDLPDSSEKSIVGDLHSNLAIKEEEHGDEIQNFLENIPFEEVLAKVIKTDSINRIVAVNKDLVMTVVDAFASKGSGIESVTPGFMYGKNINFTEGLTKDNVRTVLNNLETLRVGNLLVDQQKIVSPQVAESEKSPELAVKKPQSLRQYILIGIFATLLVIFVVVYLNLGASKNPPSNKQIKNSAVNDVNVPTPIPTLPQAPITNSPNDLKSIQIKIVQNPQSEILTDNLKNSLLAKGFQNIISDSSPSIPEKSSIIFSQNISTDVRNIVIEEVKKTLPNVVISESQDVNSTISILIGKS